MKILHLIPSYLPAYRYGGPIKSVHQLNKWLVKKGIEVTVYTTNIDGPNYLNVPLGQAIDIDGVKVFYFPITFRPWQYSYLLHRALTKNIADFDVIHITSVFLFASTLGAYYARKFNKPYIISPRGSLMEEPLEKKSSLKKKIYISLIEKRNLAGASAIHFTTEAEKEEYLRAGLPFRKALIIPNGLDIEEFTTGGCDSEARPYDSVNHKNIFREKFGIPSKKKIILFLSRLNWKKGLDTLIPAFSEVVKEEPETVLILAGGDDEGYSKKVKQMAVSFGLIKETKRNSGDKVIFSGMLLGRDKIAAFQDSDLFVLPSYSENFGIAVVEAMYFGLPVIITKNVGISPSVEQWQAGIVIEKDKRQLVDAILKILNNPALAKKMGQKGKQLAVTEFSWPEIAEKFIEGYNKLIN